MLQVAERSEIIKSVTNMSQLKCKKTPFDNFTCHKIDFHILGYIHDYSTLRETFHNNTHKKDAQKAPIFTYLIMTN